MPKPVVDDQMIGQHSPFVDKNLNIKFVSFVDFYFTSFSWRFFWSFSPLTASYYNGLLVFLFYSFVVFSEFSEFLSDSVFCKYFWISEFKVFVIFCSARNRENSKLWFFTFITYFNSFIHFYAKNHKF